LITPAGHRQTGGKGGDVSQDLGDAHVAQPMLASNSLPCGCMVAPPTPRAYATEVSAFLAGGKPPRAIALVELQAHADRCAYIAPTTRARSLNAMKSNFEGCPVYVCRAGQARPGLSALVAAATDDAIDPNAVTITKASPSALAEGVQWLLSLPKFGEK
jgi:hypothetical protein